MHKTSLLTSIASVAIAATIAPLASCNMFHEDLPPCEVNHNLRFRWERNMLFTDAFEGNVSSVEVYGFDSETGVLAFTRKESAETLWSNNNSMSLSGVAPGEYDLVAWCGLVPEGEDDPSFVLPDLQVGVSTLDELNCRMEREINTDGTHHSSSDLYDLYHGKLDNVVIYSPDDSEHNMDSYTYTVDLTKDTNRVRIILQQLSGDDIDPMNFTYTIEESNGLLHHDNSLLDDEMITYHPWRNSFGQAGIDTDLKDHGDTRAITNVRVAIADLTTSRLMADRQSILTVKNGDGDLVARIPLTDYALLVKGNYNKKMTDQEYLDRQDSYTLTFFLDANHHWVSSQVIINSWKVVFKDANFD